MAHLDSPSCTTEESASQAARPEGDFVQDNGKAREEPAELAAPATFAAGSQPLPSHIKRAEAVAERLACWASVCGRTLVTLMAHAREAVEDIWAEAQSIRRGKSLSQNPSKLPTSSETSEVSG
jgi:hypothetical protein